MTGRRALVIGLAETGVAVTRVLRADGWEVVVAEDHPRATGPYPPRAATVRELGADLLEVPDRVRVRDVARGVDLVVPSPLVRPDHPAIVAAQAAGVPVRSEIDLAAERAARPIVAVTGTNGKTTVTTLTTAVIAISSRSRLAAISRANRIIGMYG